MLSLVLDTSIYAFVTMLSMVLIGIAVGSALTTPLVRRKVNLPLAVRPAGAWHRHRRDLGDLGDLQPGGRSGSSSKRSAAAPADGDLHQLQLRGGGRHDPAIHAVDRRDVPDRGPHLHGRPGPLVGAARPDLRRQRVRRDLRLDARRVRAAADDWDAGVVAAALGGVAGAWRGCWCWRQTGGRSPRGRRWRRPGRWRSSCCGWRSRTCTTPSSRPASPARRWNGSARASRRRSASSRTRKACARSTPTAEGRRTTSRAWCSTTARSRICRCWCEPERSDALIVGLGAGHTAGSILQHEGTRVEVVELSDASSRARSELLGVNYDVMNNPNLSIRMGDGRNFLLTTHPQVRPDHH